MAKGSTKTKEDTSSKAAEAEGDASKSTEAEAAKVDVAEESKTDEKTAESDKKIAESAEKLAENIVKVAEQAVAAAEDDAKKAAEAAAEEANKTKDDAKTAGTKRAASDDKKDAKPADAKKAKTADGGLHPLLAEVAATQSNAATSKIDLNDICTHTLFETTKHNRCLLCSYKVSLDGNNSTKAKKSRYVCLQCGKAFHVNCFTVYHNLDKFAQENPTEAARIDRAALEKYVGQTRVREKRTSADVGFPYVKLPW